MNNIKLFNQQVSHTNKLISILDKYPLAFDFSMMGTGKTYTSSFIGKNYKNVIVVCPVSIKSKWEYMKSYYNINITKRIRFRIYILLLIITDLCINLNNHLFIYL